MKALGFHKSERIVSQKLIDELFNSTGSHSLAAFPVRAVYMSRPRLPGEPEAQVLMSVPKKRFRHAVDRNRTKRQLREAYRLHKPQFVARIPTDRQLAVAFIWLSDKHFTTVEVDKRVKNLLIRIAKSL